MATGEYIIVGIPAGEYSATASKEGYVSQTKIVTVTAGETARVHWDMIPIIGAGDIKGRVIDRFGSPIVNAKAVIIETGQFDYTDSEGYFVITAVPVGIHTIEISREDYAAEYIDVDIAEGLNELVEPIMLSTAKIPWAMMIAGTAVLAGILATIMFKR